MSKPSGVLLGIDIFKEGCDRILGKRNVALVTGSSVVDSSGCPVFQAVKTAAGNRLSAVWSLQHGFFIDKQDNMVLSDSFYWDRLGCRVHSLYGKTRLPRAEMLEGIDALLIDVFDVGTRVYTFLNHLVMIMEFLSGKGVDVIVLDRPNPLNGQVLEGNVLVGSYSSIVGAVPVPMRHGLTPGEYLSFALTHLGIQLNLEVVKLENWRRRDPFSGIWTYPSPNLPSYRTARVYPGAVMLEGTNISEGRGTTRPFEMLGSPFLNNQNLITALNRLKPDGVSFVPVFFKPEFSKYSGQVCQGILVNPGSPDAFHGFQVFYEIIRLIKQAHPGQFRWKKPPYEFEYRRLPIDMITGSDFIRQSLEDDLPFSRIKPEIDSQILAYSEQVGDFLLY